MSKPTNKEEQRPFLTDVQELRRRAREHMDQGAVTHGYRADRNTVIKVLNDVVATELVCVLRYKRHYYMASGINAQTVAQEFLAHANEEQGHADLAAERIVQLGGAPDLDPAGLTARSHSQYIVGTTLEEMIQENLVAERIAIESYGDIIRYLGNDDPTTRSMIEGILATEEEHAEDMKALLESFAKKVLRAKAG